MDRFAVKCNIIGIKILLYLIKIKPKKRPKIMPETICDTLKCKTEKSRVLNSIEVEIEYFCVSPLRIIPRNITSSINGAIKILPKNRVLKGFDNVPSRLNKLVKNIEKGCNRAMQHRMVKKIKSNNGLLPINL
jgi:hypothetical protein